MRNSIRNLKVKPGQVCQKAYCSLDKPFIEHKTQCRKAIEEMVVRNQKSSFDYMLDEAKTIIRAYCTDVTKKNAA